MLRKILEAERGGKSPQEVREKMNYMIASFEQIHGNLNIDISVSGNQYVLGIWDKEKHESTTSTFETLEDAYKVYEKLISWCVFGYYNDDDKKEFLRTGTMK